MKLCVEKGSVVLYLKCSDGIQIVPFDAIKLDVTVNMSIIIF